MNCSSSFGDVFAASGTGHAPRPIIPLADVDIQHFIRHGYVRVQSSLSPVFHANVAALAQSLNAGGAHYGRGWAGNDCYPDIPELGAVLLDPVVHGAFVGLLGSAYALHPHRHCHISAPGNDDQAIHQDSYEDDQATRHHRPRWVMAMYYPHSVDQQRAPTALVPGSHFYNDPHGVSENGPCFGRGSGRKGHWCHDTEEWHAIVPGGTVVIVHYELWHRATKLRSSHTRFMFKFLLCRMEEPVEPSWSLTDRNWPDADVKYRAIWHWMLGGVTNRDSASAEEPDESATVEELIEQLQHSDERKRLDACYRLGRVGSAAVNPLVRELRREAATKQAINLARHHTNLAQLFARTALVEVGEPAIAALTALLLDPLSCSTLPCSAAGKKAEAFGWMLRASAADALGDMGRVGISALPALSRALQLYLTKAAEEEEAEVATEDEAENEQQEHSTLRWWAIRNAVEALGYIGHPLPPASTSTSQEMLRCLATLASHEPAPSWIRHNAVLAIGRLGPAIAPRRVSNGEMSTQSLSLSSLPLSSLCETFDNKRGDGHHRSPR